LNNGKLAAPLQLFVEQITTLIEEESAEEVFLPKICVSMKALIRQDTWLDPDCELLFVKGGDA